MKQAKLKHILIPVIAIFFLMLVYVMATLTIARNSPAEGEYVMNLEGNITYNATIRESSQYRNITNVSLWLKNSTLGTFYEASKHANATGLVTLGGVYDFVVQMNGSVRGTYTWSVVAKSEGLSPINESFDFGGSMKNNSFNTTSLLLDHLPIRTIEIRNISAEGDVLSSTLYTWDTVTGNVSFVLSNENMTKWNNTILNITYYLNTSETATSNRTLYFRPPPVVSLHYPADSAINQTIDFINFSVKSNAPNVYCTLYTNETGTFQLESSVYTVSADDMNTTNQTIDHEFDEADGIKYGVFCAETPTQYSNLADIWAFSANRTVDIDSTAPTVTGFVPANGSYSNSSDLTVNITVTDINLHSCWLYVGAFVNYTNNAMTSGTTWEYTLGNMTDGEKNLSFICNDTARNEKVYNYSVVTIDTTYPTINGYRNSSIPGDCGRFNVSWNTSEATNGSLNYGTNIAGGVVVSSPDLTALKHSALVEFNDSTEETLYYFNLTSCDLAENCINSNFTHDAPTMLCAGWSEFAWLEDTGQNISDILSISNADYLYNWNATGQAWSSVSSAGAGDGGMSLYFGDVYFLYTSTNETFWRNFSGVGINEGAYNYNFTTGDNYISITNEFNFANLTETLNSSFYIGNFNNFSYFSAWNNSGKDTVDYRYNFSWNNETLLGRTHDLESVWIWAMNNVSWNMTNITGNFSGG